MYIVSLTLNCDSTWIEALQKNGVVISGPERQVLRGDQLLEENYFTCEFKGQTYELVDCTSRRMQPIQRCLLFEPPDDTDNEYFILVVFGTLVLSGLAMNGVSKGVKPHNKFSSVADLLDETIGVQNAGYQVAHKGTDIDSSPNLVSCVMGSDWRDRRVELLVVEAFNKTLGVWCPQAWSCQGKMYRQVVKRRATKHTNGHEGKGMAS